MAKRIVYFFFMLTAIFYASRLQAGESVNRTLKERFPELKVASIREAPIAGLYEVLTDEGRIFYYDPKTNHRLFGELITQEGKNLTAVRRAEVAADKIDRLPIDKAIRIGNGKNVVIEFLDPDCPFCRRSSRYLKKQRDLTRYIFLIPPKPLPDGTIPLHPDAIRKSKYILCAPDKGTAIEEVFSGDLDDQKYPVCNNPDLDRILDEHQKIADELGVRGTPVFFINKHRVDGANMAQIEKLLQNGPS